MATYTQSKTKLVSLKQGEPDFFFSDDNIKLVPRASVEIPAGTPSHVVSQIEYYVSRGYIRSVAYMTEQEYLMSKLAKPY